MVEFVGEPDYEHREVPAVGILIANLGTPDAPTARALRPYLKEFLSDPRVIEISRPVWWVILHLFILPFRPKRSAALYRNIWTDQGSPLLAITRKQVVGLQELLTQEVGSPVHFAVGMRYGQPSIANGLEELRRQGCRRILVLPLYPQYFAGTTGSTFDAVAEELTAWRWVPGLRTIHEYHDDPAYIAALAASIGEVWERDGKEPEKLLMSFHGIPQRYFDAGDPYFCHCQKTGRLLAEALELPEERWMVVFQSLFGREEWIKPYAEPTIKALARSGVKHIDVVCPGFAADCLETVDEMGRESREVFLENGGETYRFINSLNDRPDHLRMLADLILRNLGGWVESPGEWSDAKAELAAEATDRRAETMKATPAPADGGVAARG